MNGHRDRSPVGRDCSASVELSLATLLYNGLSAEVPHRRFRANGRLPRRDARCAGSRLDAKTVIDSRPNALLASEVSFGRLNRDVPEQELNLLQLATRKMAESSTCPPEVVRREPINARFTGILSNDVPDRFLRQTVTLGTPLFVYPPEHLSGHQIRSLNPLIEESFDPA